MRSSILLFALAATALATWIPVGPDGANVTATAISPCQPSTMFATVYRDRDLFTVFRTDDGGQAWSNVGVVPFGDGLLADAFDPVRVYFTSGPVFYRSADGGATWVSTFLPFSVMDAACDRFVPGRIYAAGMLFDSIWLPAIGISTDNGANWSSTVVSPDGGSGYSVSASPLDSGTVYFGADGGRFFASTDHGETWQLRAGGLPPSVTIQALSASHGDAGVLLAGTGEGVYRTTDGGASWSQTAAELRVVSIDFSPAEPAKAYSYAYDTGSACYATTDGGATWQRQASIVSGSRRNCLFADRQLGDGVWCPTVAGVMRSADRGAHWSPASGGLRGAVVTALAVPAWDRQQAYVALENVGLFCSDDAGQSWRKFPDFLACGNLCGVSLAPGSPHDRLYAFEGAG
jgi:photosystem II stability/assembly factor-like uncharacterized protein